MYINYLIVSGSSRITLCYPLKVVNLLEEMTYFQLKLRNNLE